MNSPHRCYYPGCNRCFSSKKGLENHIRQTHIISIGPYRNRVSRAVEQEG